MGCCQLKGEDKRTEIEPLEKKQEGEEHYQVKYRPSYQNKSMNDTEEQKE